MLTSVTIVWQPALELPTDTDASGVQVGDPEVGPGRFLGNHPQT
jgi:hypothetical protein